jgi:hypothetical protein
MPTVPYVNSPYADDEDEGFSQGLTNDMQEVDPTAPPQIVSAGPTTPPVAAPITKPQGNDDDFIQPYMPPDRSRLAAAQGKLATDSAPTVRDSTTNPKWWERVLGGLTAGAMAYGHVPSAVEAGGAVTSRRYDAAEADRQKRVQADQAAIGSEQSNLKNADTDYERQLQNANARIAQGRVNALNSDREAQEQQRRQAVAPATLQPDDPKNPMGSWHGQTIEGKPVALPQPPDSWLKTPAGKQAVIVDTMTKAGIKPGTEDWKYGLINGKLKEPSPVTNIHVPSAEMQTYNDLKAAAIAENGGKPLSLAQLQELKRGTPPAKRGTPGQFSALDASTAADYAKAEADYRKTLAIAGTDEEKAAARADLEASKARIGAEHSQRLRDLGGVPAEDGQPRAAVAPVERPGMAPTTRTAPAGSAPVAAPQQTKVKAGTVKVGDPVSYNGRTGTVTGINPTTGKPIVSWR